MSARSFWLRFLSLFQDVKALAVAVLGWQRVSIAFSGAITPWSDMGGVQIVSEGLSPPQPQHGVTKFRCMIQALRDR